MSQTNRNFNSLSNDIGHRIATLLSPLSRASLGRAFAQGTSKFNFTWTQKRSARVWDLIFKDDSWFQAIDSLSYDSATPAPNPTLVGYDLAKLYHGSSTSAYIALLVSDWGGDCRFFKKIFFASLRDHDYNEKASEVHFKKTNIILHIGDVVNGQEWIQMEDPGKLFRRNRRKWKLQTAALYFKEESLIRVGSEKIGRVLNMPAEKECIKNICSLQLEFGDGTPVYRVIRRRNMTVRLVSIETTDKNGRKWVTNWRVARADETNGL
ncbi:hypothetical protein V491_00904 [Pseudogymnoascus sp. VKM F-3775]|nr:hypothetical protein V491_00904 [Pseudogymnoascus sp. VKM F-3775]